MDNLLDLDSGPAVVESKGKMLTGNLPAASIGAAMTGINAYFNRTASAAAVGTTAPTPTPIPILTTLK